MTMDTTLSQNHPSKFLNPKPIDNMIEQNTISETPTTVSEIELFYRSKIKPSDRPTICHSNDSFNIFRANWDPNKIELFEQFKVLYLNRASRVLGIIEISTGGISGTLVDPRLIFVTALKLGATAIILGHNHPSGNLSPSDEDKAMTEKLKWAGKLLDIKVCEHIILSSEGYYSFADDGLI